MLAEIISSVIVCILALAGLACYIVGVKRQKRNYVEFGTLQPDGNYRAHRSFFDAIEEALIVNGQAPIRSLESARAALHRLVAYEIQMATDPAISSQIAALLENERREGTRKLAESFARLADRLDNPPDNRDKVAEAIIRWNEATGALPRNGSWLAEVIGMAEDAYNAGLLANGAIKTALSTAPETHTLDSLVFVPPDGEWRGFAMECATQYGAAYLDDDATVVAMSVERLVDFMYVLGYRHHSIPVGYGRLTAREQRATLENPAAIALLVDLHDCWETECDASDMGCGPAHRKRAHELLALGRAVIALEPDAWPTETKMRFSLRRTEDKK